MNANEVQLKSAQAPKTHENSGFETGEMESLQLMAGPDTANLKQLQGAANASQQVNQLRSLQAAANNSAQVQQAAQLKAAMQTKAGAKSGAVENKNGLPSALRAGIESLSGMDMSDVKVHYNSSKPASLGALAYAQGNSIFIGAGQEQHLPHEAWHVVQQRQGRVKANAEAGGEAINNDPSLENEADQMGAKALIVGGGPESAESLELNKSGAGNDVSQLKSVVKYGSKSNDCGTEMAAQIDHTDVTYGSSPQEQPSWWSGMSSLSSNIATFMSRYMVQGHLLNDNVGGPGVMKNMTPITKSTNTQMLWFFEKEVKDAVLRDGYDVDYFVQADYSNHPTANELAGSKLSSTDKNTLDNSGYLDYMAHAIYAHYDIKDANGIIYSSQGRHVKNESNESKGNNF